VILLRHSYGLKEQGYYYVPGWVRKLRLVINNTLH
jgi:hypothetical protein